MQHLSKTYYRGCRCNHVMGDTKNSGFGKGAGSSDDTYHRYLKTNILLGFPSEGLNGGYVTEISDYGLFFNPYILNVVSHYELSTAERPQLVTYNFISRITPVSRDKLEEIIEQLNVKLCGQKKKPRKSRTILMPDEVSFIITPPPIFPFGQPRNRW